MSAEVKPEHFDVLVVGAGVSGIGAGYHLQKECPDRSFAILEGRSDIGGTWDLFRYPGVRSDSDMHTLGYSFRPWTGEKSIADGESILKYVQDTAAQFGIDRFIRFNHQVRDAAWSSETARWTLTVDLAETGTTVRYTCSYLFMCSGYYSYRGGHTPEFPGRERFEGDVVHPQQWPNDLDHGGKRVVVIGSGATAMTLVPAMAETATKVTMLQRSPTYVVARPDQDPVATKLRRWLPDPVAHRLVRGKNIFMSGFFYGQTRKNPDKIRERLLDGVRHGIGPDYDVDTHFTPSYDPWDQRLCLIPNGDLFKAIRSGRAEVVTDTIDTFTESGIRTTSGRELEADIVVTATGLQLVTLGEMDFTVDGAPVDFARTWTYKGIAYSDIPNMASTFGYINASWTLRADMVCHWVCRVLNHLRETGTDTVTPRLRPSDVGMPERPWIDDFSSGYIQRMMPKLPRQGDREPWLNTQRYGLDRKLIAKAPVVDDVLEYRYGAESSAGSSRSGSAGTRARSANGPITSTYGDRTGDRPSSANVPFHTS